MLRAGEELEAEVERDRRPVERNEEEKGISIRELERALASASEAVTERLRRLQDRWLERLLGPEHEEVPSSSHVAYLRRLSPLEAIYTRSGRSRACMDTLARLGFDLEHEPNIKLDLDDRPQKSPRACVIPADPPQVVHLITRAQGGCTTTRRSCTRPGTRSTTRAATPRCRTPSATSRATTRSPRSTRTSSRRSRGEPGWHARYFGLSDEEAQQNAEATTFLEALLFRRYVGEAAVRARLLGPLRARTADRRRLRGAPDRGDRACEYRRDGYLADMDAGFYSADYLRAWIRSAQLRSYLEREVGEDWWASKETGDRLRALFREGTQPSSEEIAGRIGFEPLDTGAAARRARRLSAALTRLGGGSYDRR